MTPAADPHARFAPWLLAALVALLLLPSLVTAPLIDRDEPRFATATREMVERGDWIVPTFNGDVRFDKPVLTYWMMRAGYAVCGFGETGARVHSLAATIATVLAIALAGARWVGRRAALTAAVGFATCLQVFIHGQLALADMPMIAAVTVAQFALAELLLREDRAPARGWWWALHLALGLGFLAKGPIAWAVPVLSVILLRFAFWRRPLPWRRLRPVPGLLVVLAIIAAWGVPALIATHGEFLTIGMGRHVVQRGIEPFNARSYNPLFYLFTAPLSLFPWIAAAGFAWQAARRDWSAKNAWFVAWLVAPYVIFTAYATQLPHYVLPGFPAFFLLMAQGLEAAGDSRGVRIVRRVLPGVAALLLAGVVVFALAPTPAGAGPVRWACAGTLTVVAGLALGASGWLAGPVARAVPGWMLVAVGGAFFGWGLHASNPSVKLGELARELPAGTRWIGSGFGEGSLIFYTHAHWEFVEPAGLAAALPASGPAVVVAPARESEPLAVVFGRPRWRDREPTPPGGPDSGWTRTTIAGFNTGRSRWQELAVWIRRE